MGNIVELNHGGGYVTRYAHNKRIWLRLEIPSRRVRKLRCWEIAVDQRVLMFTSRWFTTESQLIPSSTFARSPELSSINTTPIQLLRPDTTFGIDNPVIAPNIKRYNLLARLVIHDRKAVY